MRCAECVLSRALSYLHHYAFHLLLCLGWFSSLFGIVVAENQVSHTLTVTLPRILFVRLDTQPLHFDTNTNSTTQELSVRSSSAWQLSASFLPCSSNDPPHLTITTAQRSESLKLYPRVLAFGAATTNWELLNMDINVVPAVTETACQNLLLYTFTQP
jgi:hypothetical protein